MNSLPPFAASTPTSDHPALESIAAYLDGRLPESEKAEMAAHLDSCASCYEIYAESMRFQSEERAAAGGTVVPFERKTTPWIPPRLLRPVALPIAAALLVGVGYAVWNQLQQPPGPRSVESLTAALTPPSDELMEKLGPFDVNRGGTEEQDVNYPVAAFQSGATLVDLRVAVGAGDAEKIHLFAHSLGVIYHNTSSFSPEPEKEKVQAAVTRFLEAAPSPKVPNAQLTDLGLLEEIFRPDKSDELAPHFELGAWTEAGRLAAFDGRVAFFADAANRRWLNWFREKPPIPEVKAALDKIDDHWPEAEAEISPANRTLLFDQFYEVIEPYNVSITED